MKSPSHFLSILIFLFFFCSTRMRISSRTWSRRGSTFRRDWRRCSTTISMVRPGELPTRGFSSSTRGLSNKLCSTSRYAHTDRQADRQVTRDKRQRTSDEVEKAEGKARPCPAKTHIISSFLLKVNYSDLLSESWRSSNRTASRRKDGVSMKPHVISLFSGQPTWGAPGAAGPQQAQRSGD